MKKIIRRLTAFALCAILVMAMPLASAQELFTPEGVLLTVQIVVTLADGTALSPAEVTALSPDGLTVRVVLKQGVYHQIKRMFGVYGAGVNGLHRDAIGGLALDENLAPGQWRELSDDEVAEITRG